MRKGENSIFLENTPSILAWVAVGGSKEGEGPLGESFDYLDSDGYFGEKTWELAESRMQQTAIKILLTKAGIAAKDIQVAFAGDLVNQCTSSSYSVRDFKIPFLGLYGACSTMAESLLMSALFVDASFANTALAITSSHFCTAERQFRFPLEYGSQRAPSAQWTATACGAVLLGDRDKPPYIRAVTIGTIQDLGITDANNMGAAMAPAAVDTLKRFFRDSGKSPSNFDAIFTGDLGQVGSDLLIELLRQEGIEIRSKHRDCGLLLFDRETQNVQAGASGCGCSASVLTSHIIPKLQSGEYGDILFVATGALMSTVAIQQGESIPGIAHLVWISSSC